MESMIHKFRKQKYFNSSWKININNILYCDGLPENIGRFVKVLFTRNFFDVFVLLQNILEN